ncbi:ribonuclease HII [Kocuria sp. ZOR0020]|uniref:ribonuclease HII n=1 Tax=Kocuria sp. ZOR0020 TaxID=1339234 RepID=UPI00068FFD79|nr:ribonuclease HII [Kocuria sp. ZOR0020]
MAVTPAPTLDLEHELMVAGRAGQGARPVLIGGMDEVGRGALAGPATVGVAVVDASTGPVPGRLRDSKLLRPAVRDALVPEIEAWVVEAQTGSSTPEEIDALGIVGALRLAGRRAVAALEPAHLPDLILLDGVHDWLTEPAADLFAPLSPVDAAPIWTSPVRTVVKGDMRCASIAAASVVAKVHRDRVMEDLHQQFPAYGWLGNKGYGAAAHRAALMDHGVTVHHRRSWKLGV